MPPEWMAQIIRLNLPSRRPVDEALGKIDHHPKLRPDDKLAMARIGRYALDSGFVLLDWSDMGTVTGLDRWALLNAHGRVKRAGLVRTIAPAPHAIYRAVFIGEREPTEAEALQADSLRDVLSELRSVESRLGDTSTHAYALSWLTPKLNRCYQPRQLGEVEVERSMRTLHRCGYLQMLTIEQDGGHELTVRYHVANWSDFRQARMATP